MSTLARQHESMDVTLARKHVSTQDKFGREHASTQITKLASVLNCCRKVSVNLSSYSEAIIYKNIFGDMEESSDSINDILLENIDKEIPINFSLINTPVKDTPSVCKTSTISKLENYIDKNYDEATKIQLKQAILREVKQKLPNETKGRRHVDELLRNFHGQISSLKSGTGFLREEVKEKTMSLEHCSDETPVNAKVAVHVKVRNSATFLNASLQN